MVKQSVTAPPAAQVVSIASPKATQQRTAPPAVDGANAAPLAGVAASPEALLNEPAAGLPSDLPEELREALGELRDRGVIKGDVRVETLEAQPGNVRYFDGRPVRPARRLWMTVTAYSPDERSCGIWADGITASNKSVWTNAMRLVAADTRILPFGSLISLDDYADGDIVPVLDRGGAIKGMRLDVLYATHVEALQFGVKRVPVTVWEYADE